MSRFKTLQVVYDERGNVLKKECGTCHELKDVSEFYKDKRNKDGILTQCKECGKIYKKRNKDHIAAYQKEYYQDNRDKLCKYNRELQAKKRNSKINN